MTPPSHVEEQSRPGPDAPNAATDAIAAAEQQRVLVAELNHRVRNMLQVVIGIANQTLRRSADIKEFEQGFMGRMQALARAYDLLSREGWRRISLIELVRTQLDAFASDESRCSLAGEDLELAPNAALALGLVLYELATNATKYGSLSSSEGCIAISWRIEREAQGPVLVVKWKETGGPAVREPAREGFGSELLRRQLHHELSGDVAMIFHQGGLEATLRIPARESVVDARASLVS